MITYHLLSIAEKDKGLTVACYADSLKDAVEKIRRFYPLEKYRVSSVSAEEAATGSYGYQFIKRVPDDTDTEIHVTVYAMNIDEAVKEAEKISEENSLTLSQIDPADFAYNKTYQTNFYQFVTNHKDKDSYSSTSVIVGANYLSEALNKANKISGLSGLELMSAYAKTSDIMTGKEYAAYYVHAVLNEDKNTVPIGIGSIIAENADNAIKIAEQVVPNAKKYFIKSLALLERDNKIKNSK